MPNRLIKESVCTSDKINALSDFLFRLWTCLITYVDDYGRGDARPAIIKGRCFPLREQVTVTDIEEGLHELSRSGCILIYEVDGENYLCFPNWESHQTIRNKKSKYPEPPADDGRLKSIESNCNQLKSNASKCPRNPIQSESISESLSVSEPLLDDDEAREIQKEQNRILDAADDAGFKVSNSVRAALIRLYADYGLEKMLDGIASCVKHGATNLAYLEAVLKGSPKQEKPKVIAQDFKQRSYEDVDKRLMENLAKEVEQYKKEHPKEFEKQEGA